MAVTEPPSGRRTVAAPTLAHVAALAGVSLATASRVINGSARVSERARTQVEDAIRRLGYVRHRAAPNGSYRRAGPIAAVICEDSALVFADHFFARMLCGIGRELGERQLIMLMAAKAERWHAVADCLHGGHVEGALLISAHRDHPLALLRATGVPLLLAGRPLSEVSLPYVDADNRGGARTAVEHLLRSGRRTIAAIAGPPDMAAGLDRLAGYRDALAAAGHTAPGLVAYGGFRRASGEHAMNRLLGRRPDLDAVFAASDLMAAGALRALHRAGRRVPEDVAVVGFDDSPVARHVRPRLTTVRQPVEEMGARIVRELGRRVAGKAPLDGCVVLGTKLIVRVEDSIKTLGYHPHAGARSLASSRANVIALVVPIRTDMHVPILMQFATSVVTGAREHDHDVLLLTNDEGPDGLRRVAASALVDAVIVMDIELDDGRLPVLRELGLPAVLIGFPADPSGLTCVDLDFVAAAAMCVDHLADLGHREIAFLGPPAAVFERGTGFARRTTSGFESAAARRGLRAVLRPCEPSHGAVRDTVKRLFDDHPGLTGLVVHNEAAVAPLLETLRALGRHVPQHVSVVAICPEDLAEHVSPRLTAVPIPAEKIARRAVHLVMGKLDGAADVPPATLITPHLLPGESTAAGEISR